MAKERDTKTWFAISLGAIMPELSPGGKEVWKSLKTSHLSVAQPKLAEFLKEHRERASNGNTEVSARMTLGEAAAIHLRNL